MTIRIVEGRSHEVTPGGAARGVIRILGPFEGFGLDPLADAIVGRLSGNLPEGEEVISWQLAEPSKVLRDMIHDLEVSMQEAALPIAAE